MVQKQREFAELVGQTIVKVEIIHQREMVFTLENTERARLYHDQACCEDVLIEDISGNLDDLVGSPILMAEEATSNENPPGVPVTVTEYQESFTWTFYKMATIKGYVTIRWYGQSNGYYSECVAFDGTW